MGWFGDTLKVILGMDEDQHAYRDLLAKAERLVHLGVKEHTPADIIEALSLLAECDRSLAPNAHYSYRYERTKTQAHVVLAGRSTKTLVSRIQNHEELFTSIQEGRTSLRNQIQTLQQKVKNLEAEGSLISAREERRRLEEMEREVRDLPDLNDERARRLADILAEVAPQFKLHRDGAVEGLKILRDIRGLSEEDQAICDKVIQRLESELQDCEKTWNELTTDVDRQIKELKATPAGQPAKA